MSMQTITTARHGRRSAAERALDMSRAEAEVVIAKMQTSATYGWLAIGAMRVDPRVQRVLRPAWVKRHEKLFDPNQVGVVLISRRSDGTLYITDGQHRVELLRAVGWGDQSIYCEIFDGISIQEEAALFLKRNDKISVRSFDKFAVNITGGDEAVCGIVRVVHQAGLVIAEGLRDGCISAVGALQRIYSGGGIASDKEGCAALKLVLLTIQEAWGKPAANFQGHVIEGLGIVFLRYGSKIDRPALVAKLSKIGGGAAGLIGQARGLRDLHGGSIPSSVGGVVVQRYNRGRRGGKLEGWWS